MDGNNLSKTTSLHSLDWTVRAEMVPALQTDLVSTVMEIPTVTSGLQFGLSNA